MLWPSLHYITKARIVLLGDLQEKKFRFRAGGGGGGGGAKK